MTASPDGTPGAIPDPFAPAPLGPVTLRNRIVKAATYEGMTPDGVVTDRLVEFHRRAAAGGVGMTTVAYCAVSPEGRTYANQLWMRPDVLPGLRVLVDAVHDEGAAVALQLGHAGWFSVPKETGLPAIGPSRMFSPHALRWSRAASADVLRRIRDDYRAAAAMAVDCGADAVELHMGHGYLLSQFLSPFTNRRDDDYGGSVANRARFLREVAFAVRDTVGDRIAVYAKLNMTDGFRRGLTLPDGIAVARLLEADGALDALQLTVGFTAVTPMFLMRGDTPIADIVRHEPDRLRRFGLRLFARRVIRSFPFEEAFLADAARQVRAATSMPLMLLGGVTGRATVDAAMADGFAFVAMARALLRDPDLPLQMRDAGAGPSPRSTCISCNRCITEMYVHGTRCVFEEAWPDAPMRPVA